MYPWTGKISIWSWIQEFVEALYNMARWGGHFSTIWLVSLGKKLIGYSWKLYSWKF